ncbi:MAG: diacylglycerol kinase family lipid kinase [Actinomycetia bacterium]|nr:diacylglycerol kinase family lipid kinase [Actinomycetes bacterium]
MSPTRYLAIVNPAARSGAARDTARQIEEKLTDLDVTFVNTEYPRHAVELAAASHPYDVICAIGGDGTIHEIVNGMMQIADGQRPCLGLIPLGSGNDTCRMIGSPTTIDEAIAVIRAGRTKAFDLGLCNETYFVNSFSIGLDALTVAATTKIKEETGRSGMLLYGQALIGTILFNLKPTVLDITIDGVTYRREVLLHTVTNGKTYGGGFRINPFAHPADGKLTMSRIEWMPALKTLTKIPSLLRATHHTLDEYETQEIESVTFSSVDGSELVAQIDGEILKGRTFAIEVRPFALRFVVEA